jgi:hypothetical protein
VTSVMIQMSENEGKHTQCKLLQQQQQTSTRVAQ